MLGGGIGGLSGGIVMGLTNNPVWSGLASGFMGNVTKQGLNVISGRKDFSPGSLIIDSALGMGLGYGFSKIPAIKGITNFGSGEILSMMGKAGNVGVINLGRATGAQVLEGLPESAVGLGASKMIEKINNSVELFSFELNNFIERVEYGPSKAYGQ